MAATSSDTAGGFRRIDHTADVGLRFTAPSPRELFAIATAGLNALWGAPPSAVAPDPAGETLEVAGSDTESLLVAWLNELIFQAAVHGRRAAHVTELTLEPERFSARVTWVPLEWERCHDGVDIKAATYHTVDITATDGGVTTSVIFDV